MNLIKRQRIINVYKDVEKGKSLYTVSGNANWYTSDPFHFYLSFLKKKKKKDCFLSITYMTGFEKHKIILCLYF